MTNLDMESKDIIKSNLEKIGEIFPDVIVEGDNGDVNIDFDLLKQHLSGDIVEGQNERYQFIWPGKKESIITANEKCRNTLRPVKDKSEDFEKTKNIYIEGDNLEALKILQGSYVNEIKCIYIDPPYNTGNDFVYNDNFYKKKKDELLDSGIIDKDGNILVSKIINTEANGSFHSSWISMMYPRLKLAKNLLCENGFLAIHIDDREYVNLLKILEELFGLSNIETVVRKKYDPKYDRNTNAKVITTTKRVHEYIVIAIKNKEKTLFGKIKKLPKWKHAQPNPDNDPRGNWQSGIVSFEEGHKNEDKNSEFYFTIKSPSGKEWTRHRFFNKETMDELINDNRIYFGSAPEYSNVPRLKTFENEEKEFVFESILEAMGSMNSAKKELAELFECSEDDVPFSTPKPTKLLKEIIRATMNKENGIILDFFAGSSSVADAVMQLNSEDKNYGNLRYIMIQLPEVCEEKTSAYKLGYKNICDIGEDRIRRAGKKIKEETKADIDYGFRVFKVDSSNMKDDFYVEANKIQQSDLFNMETNIKEGRTGEDLITQVILNLGLPLDAKIEEKEIGGNKFFFVDKNGIIACFDPQFNFENVEAIAEYKPLKVVLKDESFKTNNDKINFQEKFKKLSQSTEINFL